MSMSSEEAKFYEVFVNISKTLNRIANAIERNSVIQNKSSEQLMKESKFRMRNQRNLINENKKPVVKVDFDDRIKNDVNKILESKELK